MITLIGWLKIEGGFKFILSWNLNITKFKLRYNGAKMKVHNFTTKIHIIQDLMDGEIWELGEKEKGVGYGIGRWTKLEELLTELVKFVADF